MQWRYEQLTKHFRDQPDKPLASIYLISGTEILLVQTACDTIRTHAQKQGFSEREVFYAESDLNWQAMLTHCHNYSLFAKKQIIELHLAPEVSETTAQILKTYASAPPHEQLLLIVAGKLDRRLQQTEWFKSIEAIGVSITIWPIEKSQLPSWIVARLATVGLTAEKSAIQCLISATEGNLLATAQAIEKLSLYFTADTPSIITQAAMLAALSDNARFIPFTLADAALQGEAARCLRILRRLQEEGVEPVLILGVLSRECRLLASFALQLSQGKDIKTLFRTHQVWEKRQYIFQQALQRHSLAQCYRLVRLATHCDHLAKGIIVGNIWDTLQQLSVQLAGAQTSC